MVSVLCKEQGITVLVSSMFTNRIMYIRVQGLSDTRRNMYILLNCAIKLKVWSCKLKILRAVCT